MSDYDPENQSSILPQSHIIIHKYDKYLIEWFDHYSWKLIYRASEHNYTAESFHKHCNDIGPTLIMIKSTNGWIFGGYTTQSWSGSILV